MRSMHILTFILFLLHTALALPTLSTEPTEEWIIYIPAGPDNARTIESVSWQVQQIPEITLKKLVQDENEHSFNALVVLSTQSDIKRLDLTGCRLAKNSVWSIARKLELKEGSSDQEQDPLVSPNWGLQVIAQRQNYVYPTTAGSGVDVYIVDSGIKLDHPEFENRAFKGPSFSNEAVEGDSIGHGTAVASIVGGLEYGVAKQATLISVQVTEPDGSLNADNVIRAIQWIIAAANSTMKPSVVVLSVGGPQNVALDMAVENLIRNGLHPVVAAGNEAVDACSMSPSQVNGALVVGSMDYTYQVLSSSNVGQCVDIFAPGYKIGVAGLDGGYTLKSGTSFSAPFAAGVVALALGEFSFNSVEHTFQYVKAISLKNDLKGANGSENNVLFNGITADCVLNNCKMINHL